MKSYFLLVAILLIGLTSCKKENPSARQPSLYFLNLSVDGRQYSVTDQTVFNVYQRTDESGCDVAKRYMYSNITQVDNSDFFADIYLFTVEKDIDFQGSTTGQKGMLTNVPRLLCNLDLQIEFLENHENRDYFIMYDQPYHSVITNITKVEETSSYVRYDIEGNFDGSLKSDIYHPRIIPISGSYRTFIEVSK